ncbi:hypothetical protein J1N35_037760 [Gossypium stocksii]|uniref:Uncharacterized protein n=1 Tax=Gossypium stocksii TaxID=47602 RepID=A0A9D3UKR2_9ROSI|nr:hypothetical protein J1N35_037760 [Gossypium stocksii]
MSFWLLYEWQLFKRLLSVYFGAQVFSHLLVLHMCMPFVLFFLSFAGMWNRLELKSLRCHLLWIKYTKQCSAFFWNQPCNVCSKLLLLLEVCWTIISIAEL